MLSQYKIILQNGNILQVGKNLQELAFDIISDTVISKLGKNGQNEIVVL